eukprot:GHVS01103087.1.p1 GENE.GHVS01103087.1~~GHVS01103087.1.p1  ORF type:complete len:415 (-),score=36.12 GHVS01103087.1:192-1436(-)
MEASPEGSSSLFQALRKGPLKVSVIGSGNWGSVIARIVAHNAKHSYIFHDVIRMWVFEEIVNGRKLTEIINSEHENKKYLPGFTLPENVKAVADVVECATGADLLIFVLPHQFLSRVCDQLANTKSSNGECCGVVPRHAKAISLIKGLYIENKKPELFTRMIVKRLGIDCCVLSGANVANDVAREEFSETSIGYQDKDSAAIWQQLFDTPYFRVNGVPDVQGVEVCGAVKNVVALAAGFCDGMRLGTNTKSAIIRLGVEEMKAFANLFFDGVVQETFFDSAGYADVITTCFGGRNVRCAAEFVLHKGQKSWEVIEAEMLSGQKLQGNLTCKEIYEVLEAHYLTDVFPLFTATYKVAFEGAEPSSIIKAFQSDKPRPLRLREECNSCIIPKSLTTIRTRLGFCAPLTSSGSMKRL